MQRNLLYTIVFLIIFYTANTASAFSTPYTKEPLMCLNNMSVAPKVTEKTTKTGNAPEFAQSSPAPKAVEKVMPEPTPIPIPVPTLEPTPAPSAPPEPQPVVFETPAATGYDPLFEKYAAEYGIKSSTLSIIAKCESGYNPQALSSNQLYGGMFQFSSGTWQSNRVNMGLDVDPSLRFNAEEAIRTAAFKISRDGVGAWNACGRKAL
jgi:hypothetical protein